MSTSMTDAEKKWIDTAPYEALLYKVRFAPAGDSMFLGDTGDYFIKTMKERRAADGGDAEHVRASKAIGFDR